MPEDDTRQQSDKVAEQAKPPEKSESVAREAVKSVDEIVKMKREELADQKDPNRPSKFTSLKFGRLELVSGGGSKIIVKGTPAQDALSAEQASLKPGEKSPEKLLERPAEKSNEKSERVPSVRELGFMATSEPETLKALYQKNPEGVLKALAPKGGYETELDAEMRRRAYDLLFPPDRQTGRPGEKPSEQAHGKPSDQAADKPAHKHAEKPPDRPSDKPHAAKSEKPSESAEKPAAPLSPGEHKSADGSSVTVNDKGQIVKTVDATGAAREFTWGTGPDGKPAIVAFKDGPDSYTSKDGKQWTSANGEQWIGQVSLKSDGSFVQKDLKGTHVDGPDGQRVSTLRDGGSLIEDKNGRVEKTTDANRRAHKFEYGTDGKLNKVTEPDGRVLSTKDGVNWTDNHGKSWKGTIELNKYSGSLAYFEENGPEKIKNLNGSEKIRAKDGAVSITDAQGKTTQIEKPVDRPAIEKLAQELRRESGTDNYVFTHTDRDKVFNLLKDLTQSQREALQDAYHKKYGKTLEEEYKFLDGSDKTKFLSLLHKRDGDTAGQSASIIGAALQELHEVSGASRELLEERIRTQLSKLNSEQIKELDDHFRKPPPDGHGKSLKDIIMQDSKISDATKAVTGILLQGNDRIGDDQYVKLANLAVQQKDSKLFAEIMQQASPEARKKFMGKDASGKDGEQRLKDAFGGHWYNVFGPGGRAGSDSNLTDRELNRALSYAKEGKLSVAEQIRQNTGKLFNNNEAIELALSRLTDQERKDYVRGKELSQKNEKPKTLEEMTDQERKSYKRGQELVQGNLEPKTDADKKALEYFKDQKALEIYKDLHGALDKIHWKSHEADMARWEDLIARQGGGLISKIGAHRGTIYNDSKGDVLKDIENIDKSEWQRLRNLKEGKNSDGSPAKDPAESLKNQQEYLKYHKELERALEGLQNYGGQVGRFNKDDTKRALEIFDKKLEAKTFEQSKDVRRSLKEMLDDNTHWYTNDRKGMLEAISRMTPKEAESYKNNATFRKQVDEAVKSAFKGGPGQAAAEHVLKQVAQDGKPHGLDLIAKVNMRAQERLDDPLMRSKAEDLVREIRDEFQKDPGLRQRILNNPELKNSFERMVQFSLTDSEYDKYVKPLLKDGRLPIETQLKLNDGVLSNDKLNTLKDLENLAQQAAREQTQAKEQAKKEGKEFKEKPDGDYGPASREMQGILRDSKYQDKVLGYLSAEDRKVALQVLLNKDGKVHTEDTLRIHLNHVGGSSDIKQVLRDVPAEKVDQVRSEYARKYGRDLDADLRDKLGKDFDRDLQAKFRKQASASEAHDNALDDRLKSGRSRFLDGVGSGVEHQLDDVLGQYTKAISEANRQLRELSPEQRQEAEKSLTEALKNFKESKGAAAEYAGMAVGLAVALALAPETGGVSLGAFTKLFVAGGIADVIAKQAIMGGDYDWDPAKVARNVLSGGIGAATGVIGGRQLNAIFKFGGEAGEAAAKKAVEELGGKLLQTGEKELLGKGMSKVLQDAVANGAKDVQDAAVQKAIRELAEKSVARELTGAARQEAVEKIAKSLSENAATELGKVPAKLAKEIVLHGSSGIAGGGAAGTVEGIAAWDGNKTLGENLKRIGETVLHSAAGGATAALGFTLAGKGWEAIKAHYKKGPGEALSKQDLADLAKKTGLKDPIITQDGEGIRIAAGPSDRASASAPRDTAPGQPRDTAPGQPRDTAPVTEARRPGEQQGRPERVSNEEVLRNLPREYEGLLSAPEQAALLKRLSHDPLFKAENVGSFADRATKILAEEGLSATQRGAKLQQLLNEMADKNGLPRIEIEVVDKSKLGFGAADYKDGKIRISDADLSGTLSKEGRAQLLERVYHEFTHNRQDGLVIRSLADEIKIGKSATPDEIAKLKDLYRERTRGELSDDHLQKVLRSRDGKQLGADEKTLADQYAKAFHDLPQRSPELNQLEDRYFAVKAEREKLSSADNHAAANDLTKRLAEDNGTLAKALFGSDTLPPPVRALVDAYKATGTLQAEQAKALTDAINGTLNELGRARYTAIAEATKGYYRNPTEQDAHAVGVKARLEASKGPAPEATAPGTTAHRPAESEATTGRRPAESEATTARRSAEGEGSAKPEVPRGFNPEDVRAYAREKQGLRESSPVSKHVDGTTAPTRVLTVDGHPVEVNKKMLIGREAGADVQLQDAGISRKHATIRVDENGNTFVKDLGSGNGTYINGEKLPPFAERKLGPDDKLFVGDGRGLREIKLGTEYQSTYRASVGSSELNLKVGEEVAIGRGKFGITGPGVSREHARIGMDSKGLYIVEDAAKPSLRGSYVNGERIKPGEKVYLKPTDEVKLGNPLNVKNGIPEGEYLHIMPADLAAIAPKPIPEHTVLFNKAVGQSNEFGKNHQVSGKLEDGFQAHYYSRNQEANALAAFEHKIGGNAIVIDRANDPVLRGVIQEAKERFGHLPPKERAEALNKYVNDLMMPKGMSENALDAFYDRFAKEHRGKAVLLGDYIKAGRGVCLEQAMLLKVLGDEMGLSVTLIKGAGSAGKDRINHAWVEIKFPGEKEPLIYDPRWKVSGAKQGEIAAHERGYSIDQRLGRLNDETIVNRPVDLPRPPADVSIAGGKNLEITEKPLALGRADFPNVEAFSTAYQNVSPHHVELRRGSGGMLYLKDTSSHGTWVNGRRMKPGDEWPIGPNDRINLGAANGPRLYLSEAKPPADVYVGGKRLDFSPGEQISVGRSDVGNSNLQVSRDHAWLRRGEDGKVYITDISANGIWINGKKMAKADEVPIGPNDKVRLGGPNGPELSLSEYKPPVGPERTLVDIKPPIHRASFEGKEYPVAGIDRHSGDVILKNEQAKHFAMRSHPVTADELAGKYRAIEIEGRTYYRDKNDNVLELLEFNGKKQLVDRHQFIVVPREKITAS